MSRSDLPNVREALDLTGRVALVTGGGTGLGRAIALGLGEMGSVVALAGRRRETLSATAAELARIGAEGVAVVADVSIEGGGSAMVDEAVERLGRLDILVNCAGVTLVKPSMDLEWGEWDDIHATNLKGAFFASTAAARHFETTGHGGVILNIASISALQGGAGVYSAYTASKGGLVALTRSLAVEWAALGVRVNCIAAGAFPTDMSAAAYEDPTIHAAYVRRIPLGRTGEPREIAPLAVYLVSDASSFVTGEVFVIDGGQVMK